MSKHKICISPEFILNQNSALRFDRKLVLEYDKQFLVYIQVPYTVHTCWLKMLYIQDYIVIT